MCNNTRKNKAYKNAGLARNFEACQSTEMICVLDTSYYHAVGGRLQPQFFLIFIALWVVFKFYLPIKMCMKYVREGAYCIGLQIHDSSKNVWPRTLAILTNQLCLVASWRHLRGVPICCYANPPLPVSEWINYWCLLEGYCDHLSNWWCAGP